MKTVKYIAAAVISALFLTIPSVPVLAVESTYYTYTVSLNNETYIRGQDAYMPGGVCLSEVGLNAPEDMAVAGKTLYVADTGNGRIVKYDTVSGEYAFLGGGELKTPTGVAVSDDGRIFTADYGAEAIVVLSPEGGVLKRIGRPDEIFYGKSPYKPRKVSADSYGNILALSEGAHEGILQFMPDGTFAGFFGANQTKGLDPVEWLQKTFYTDEQKSKLYFRSPQSIESLHVTDNNIYTVTRNDRRFSLKKLNLAGVDILPASGSVFGEDNYVDLTVAPNGNIFAVTDTGSIEEFDKDGWLMLLFGGRASASDRNGLTAVVSAIDIDDEYTVYTLDKERALVQTYIPTDYADILHKAGEDFNAGNYNVSLAGWRRIMRISPMAGMAHSGYASALFQLGDYKTAAYHYKLNGDIAGYSKCFFEIRGEWLRANMYTVLSAALGLAAIIFVLKIFKVRNVFGPVINGWRAVRDKRRLLRDIVSEPFYMMRHPIDCLYDLKCRARGSAFAAGVLYLLALIVCFVDRILGSFVFGGGVGWRADPGVMLLTTVLPVALFWIGSYLVSSINDGEGTLRQTFTAFGYAFAPYIVFTLLFTVLSHALTLREEFILFFLRFLVTGYTCVLIFLAVKETYGYNAKRTVSNLLLTAGFMLIAALAMIILFVLWRQLLGFCSEIFGEAVYRVFR
jgi:DNA-binding beta-propeller fold protein YncE